MNCPSCQAENHTSARHCFACGAPLAPGLEGLRVGAVFASRFEILGSLGRGGMGMVYRAWDRDLGETVAIKVLRPDVAKESRRAERRFRAEVRLARRVRHRNVCSMYGDGEDRGLRYICMELIEGENLARIARSGGGLGEAEGWDVILQVADGLQAIHKAGVVHRDLKTANLMRDREGVVRVMDFGIAKQQLGGTASSTTASGALMGTPEYMSPEQLRGEPTGFRSDLYSFGVVIYELFTGKLPFRGDTPVATILRQLQDPPKLDVPRLPPAVRPVLARALSKAASGRFTSAHEMADALRAARESASHGPARGLAGAPGEGEIFTDETLPIPSSPEPAPIVRIAAGLGAVTALAAHLLSAGGVAAPAPRLLPAPVALRAERLWPTLPAPRLPPPQAPPQPVVHARAIAIPDLDPRPIPTPEPAVAEPVVVQAPSRSPVTVEPHRIYEETEVDVPPRRIRGTSAPYPPWGPELTRGQRVSITASFVVNEDGDVTDIRVEKGGGTLQAVLLEISRWKYEPGLKDGVPVKVRLLARHTFIGG